MKTSECTTLLASAAILAAGGGVGSAQNSDIDQLKSAVQQMQQTIKAQNAKIEELEKAKATTSPPAQNDKSLSQIVKETDHPATVTVVGHQSAVPYRATLKDEQEAAPRPNDLIMDPKYHGYMPVPNTPVLIRFNAKPRVDFTYDLHNSGNDDRFVTAQIPVEGDPFKGGHGIFNINAKGSQLKL